MDHFGAAGEGAYFLMHVCKGRQPDKLRRDRVQQIVRFLYTVWYRNWFSRHFDGREAELQAYVLGLYERVAGAGARLPEYCPLEGGRRGEIRDE
jgi:hypothetical protein